MQNDTHRAFLLPLLATPLFCLLLVLAERLLFRGSLNGAPLIGFHDGPFIPIFHFLFIFTEGLGCAAALFIPLLCFVSPLKRAGIACARWAGHNPRRVAASTFVLLCAASLLVYHNLPLSQDEYAPLSQAIAFAHGHLTWKAPPELLDRYLPLRSFFFATDTRTGSVASSYWPGFALLLAPFVWLGIPWACNPMIASLSLLTLHALATRLFGSRDVGGWAMLFAVASPVFTVTAISYYSMPAHLLANLLFVWLVMEPTPRRLTVAGCIGGLALTLHNPVPHLLFALPWWLWLLSRPRGWRSGVWLALGYLPVGLLFGASWVYVVHHLQWVSPQDNRLAGSGPTLQGFGYWWTKFGGVFRWPDGLIVWLRLLGLAKLWLWAVPGLPLLAVIGCCHAKNTKPSPITWLLAASALTSLIGYMFVTFDQGHGWGYRYFHPAWGLLPLLASQLMAGPDQAAGSTRQAWDWRSLGGGLAIASLLIGTPMRLVQTESFIRWHLNHAFSAPARGRYVIFIGNKLFYYSIDLVQNLPGSDRVIRLLSAGESEDAQLMSRRFPGAQRVSSDIRGSIWKM